MNTFFLSKLSKDRRILAGSPAGRKVCQDLLEAAKSCAPGLAILDFSGIEVATSSFMREAVIGFRDVLRRERADLYPVVSNLNEVVREELLALLNQMGEAIWAFEATKGAIKEWQLLGKLDPKLKETLDLIEKGVGHDAATLWKSTNSTESVGVTAWNNRLATLARQGLVFESKVGKQKYFHSLHECRG